MKKLEFLAKEFDAIDEYIKAARAILRDGHMPDLAGLDGRVARLCTDINRAENEIQQQCLPKLQGILDRLDLCEAEIRSFHSARSGGAL